MWTFGIYEKKTKEPPIMLQPGQKVYKVIRGDIEPCVVSDEKYRTWVCGFKNEDRGYTLCRESCYDVTWNSVLGKTCFVELSDAERAAQEYLDSHDVFRAEDMRPVNTVAFSYFSKSLGRRDVIFYSELDNGMIYVKEWARMQYMASADKKDAVIKRFLKQDAFKYVSDIVRVHDYEPVFKNMYLTSADCPWERMEASHNYYVNRSLRNLSIIGTGGRKAC